MYKLIEKFLQNFVYFVLNTLKKNPFKSLAMSNFGMRLKPHVHIKQELIRNKMSRDALKRTLNTYHLR